MHLIGSQVVLRSGNPVERLGVKARCSVHEPK